MFIESLEIWVVHRTGLPLLGGQRCWVGVAPRSRGDGGWSEVGGEAGGVGRCGLMVGPVCPQGWPVGGDPRYLLPGHHPWLELPPDSGPETQLSYPDLSAHYPTHPSAGPACPKMHSASCPLQLSSRSPFQFLGTMLPPQLSWTPAPWSWGLSQRERLDEFFLRPRTEMHSDPLRCANPVGPTYMTGDCSLYQDVLKL